MKRFIFLTAAFLSMAAMASCSKGQAPVSAPETNAARESANESRDAGTAPETEALAMTEPEAGELQVSLWAGSMEAGFTDGENQDAGFLKPYGLCEGPDGKVLVVDSYSNQLRVSDGERVSALAGYVGCMGEDGLPLGGCLNGGAKDALLGHPRFAAVSREGIVVFSDTDNHCIRLLKDGLVRHVAGSQAQGFENGSYEKARFNTPSGVAIGEDGTIYVADTLNHCIREISPKGQVSVLAGTPQEAGYLDASPDQALFCEPNDIQFGPDGALYVVDKGNQRIRRITGEEVTTVAGSGTETDPDTGYITGGYRDGKALEARFRNPTGFFVEEDGSIYVADTGNHCIRLISPDGLVSTVAGTGRPGNENGPAGEAGFNQPLDVLYMDGGLYVSDSYNHAIRLVGQGAGRGKR